MNRKTIVITLSLFAGMSFIQACQSEDATKVQTNVTTAQTQSNSESVVFDMQNMTCAMCGITIKKALQAVDGVQTVTVDDDNKTASVTFDPGKTNHQALIKATTNAGYPATVHAAQ
ncbi:MAG TPA: copper chaperone [Crenotrichaceae bacterium]|nr:copper chaperone [Crenotrichaceae bacterium]